MRLEEMVGADGVLVQLSNNDWLSINNSINEVVNSFDDLAAIEKSSLTRDELEEVRRTIAEQMDEIVAANAADDNPDASSTFVVKVQISWLLPMAIVMRECVRLIGDWEHSIRTGVTVEEMLSTAHSLEALASDLTSKDQ